MKVTRRPVTPESDPIDEAFDQLFADAARSNQPTVRPAEEPLEEIEPVVVEPPKPKPKPPSTQPGLLALAITAADGALLGLGSESMAAQSSHFRRLGELLGEELGLEGLSVVLLASAKRRMISIDRTRAGHESAGAGDVIHAITLPSFDLGRLALVEPEGRNDRGGR